MTNSAPIGPDTARAWLRRPGVLLLAAQILAGVLVSAEAASGETNPYRAARSVHLSYPSESAFQFYNEMVVQKSVNGSYFMACGWDGGYFGIQQLDSPEQKVVLFSVWDPTKGDNPNTVAQPDRVKVLYEGEGVRIKRFGGEGTGGQCMWHYPWQIGATNRFLISASVEGDWTAYTARFFADGKWKRLATFQTRTSGRALNGLYSFIEDFRRDGKSVYDERRALFGNGWIKVSSSTWMPLIKARFTASNAEWESKDNIDAGLDQGEFYLATGGEIKKSRELRSTIELPLAAAPAKPPSDLAAEPEPNK